MASERLRRIACHQVNGCKQPCACGALQDGFDGSTYWNVGVVPPALVHLWRKGISSPRNPPPLREKETYGSLLPAKAEPFSLRASLVPCYFC